MADDEYWMAQALAEAELATTHHDVPVGAVVVDEGGILLARGRNQRELSGDPTAHAEVLALREAARVTGHWRLTGATVYVTLEPCTMCAGAMVNARIKRLVYAAADPKAGAIHSLFELAQDARLNHRFEVRADVMRDPAIAKLRAFFQGLRAQGEK